MYRKTVLVIGVLLFFNPISAQTDSALVEVLKIENEKERFTQLDDLCFFTAHDNPHNAKEYCELAYKLAVNIGNDSILSRVYVSMSTMHIKLGDFNAGFDWLQKSLDLRQKLGNKRDVAAVKSNIGLLLSDQGYYDSAATYYIDALRVFEEVGDSNAFGFVSINLAELFAKTEPNRRTTYAKQAIKVFSKTGNKRGLANAYETYSTEVQNAGVIDSAIYFERKALELYSDLGYTHTLMTVTNNLGFLHLRAGDTTQTLALYKIALDTAIAINDTGSMAHFSCNVASIQYLLKQYNSALTNYQNAYNWSFKNGNLPTRQLSSKGLAETYQNLGNTELALTYAWETFALRDTLFSSESVRSMQEIEQKYETEKKEKRIAILQQKEAEASLLLARQQNWIISLVASIVLLGALASFLVYRRRKRAQQKLTEAELGFRKKLIKNTVNSQEDERKRIAKELHDGIAQSLVAVKMRFEYNLLAKQKAGDNETEDDKKALDLIESLYQEVRGLSHQMMPLKLTNQGLLSAMEELLENTLKPVGINFSFEHNLDTSKRLTEHIEIALFRISQELVANILKHSQADKVHLKLTQNAGLVHLTVEDNGVGMKVSPEKEGIGLASIMARVKALNGKVEWVKSSIGGLQTNLAIHY